MGVVRKALLVAAAVAAIVALRGDSLRAADPSTARARVLLCGNLTPPSSSACGFSLFARGDGPQVAAMGRSEFVACVRAGEDVRIEVPLSGLTDSTGVAAEAVLVDGEAEVVLSLNGTNERRTLLRQGAAHLEAPGEGRVSEAVVILQTLGKSGEAAVRWRSIRLTATNPSSVLDRAGEIPWPNPKPEASGPPPSLPALRRPIETALIEWDWRMQDGIGTARNPSTYAEAIARALRRGDDLIGDLKGANVDLDRQSSPWENLRKEWKEMSGSRERETTDGARWESLWKRVHVLRRDIALRNPLANVGPLLFVKQVPSCFSHQLTQYYGSCAKPGGGVFVLDAPGTSMRCRQLAAGAFPTGSYQHPEVSADGGRVLFSYCRAETTPPNRETYLDRFYHLYETAADGSGLRRLTDGPFDDFAPRYLPNGKIIFISTRRGGFHRCGRGPCPTYTLAIANADGSDPHPISYHETHEWDPCVLNDGRVIYTRWDYVDRHAVHYEQLWAVQPDGANARAFYGNNTFNPVGVWEARPVPGSNRVMATAAAHHAMTAGSIILLDVAKGMDGLEPIARLTPDALFPESEAPVSNGGAGYWSAPAGVSKKPPAPPEQLRWPGHCYRTPYPLSEKYLLAAYSFDSLIGEPSSNPPNLFGVYLVDCFGNKELLYRDLNIASLWPTPLRPRPRPPVLPSTTDPGGIREGTFFLENVYAGWPPLPKDTVKRLRIVQVLPKSTPHINEPSVGIPNASPGKQILGTVPVEPDGSAYFRAPAGIPLAFQALDERGQAVQIMRSVTYLQPGETASCVGCHEPRLTAPPPQVLARALRRPPSGIEPGPDGSKPLSYPILVQPVLDKHCLSCHNEKEPGGGVILSGTPQGHYTASYNALASRVRYSAWGVPGDFRRTNNEPATVPGFFGARGSALMKLLLDGHEKVVLSRQEIERLATWMDANALFYGTFDREDQARQLRGERIEGPKVE
jgi:hypothetical protein